MLVVGGEGRRQRLLLTLASLYSLGRTALPLLCNAMLTTVRYPDMTPHGTP